MIPSWAQTKSFAAAATKHILDGLSEVSQEEFEGRMGVCRSCDKFDEAMSRCNECGCYLQAKAKWRTQSCPLGKW